MMDSFSPILAARYTPNRMIHGYVCSTHTFKNGNKNLQLSYRLKHQKLRKYLNCKKKREGEYEPKSNKRNVFLKGTNFPNQPSTWAVRNTYWTNIIETGRTCANILLCFSSENQIASSLPALLFLLPRSPLPLTQKNTIWPTARIMMESLYAPLPHEWEAL